MDGTTRWERIQSIVTEHGRDLIEGLVVLVVGLVLIRYLERMIRKALSRFGVTEPILSTVCNVFYVTLIVVLVAFVMMETGFQSRLVLRLLVVLCLVAVALILLFRPYIPKLPFKAGNMVRIGDLLGRVEHITLINTRVKTFDGRTFFVPNSKILNDIVINYHFTPERRIEIEVGIRYDQDLMKAKQVLEEILIEDPRILSTPRPIVHVLHLSDTSVQLSARGWVMNQKYWVTRCDLLEKTKLRFDAEGIIVAFPRREVHVYQESAGSMFPGPTETSSAKLTVRRP